jgi:hypothetical protein
MKNSKQQSGAPIEAAARAIINELSFWTDEAVIEPSDQNDIDDADDQHQDDGEKKDTLLKPSMQDCVRFLERHPLLRQVIGDLVQQEQEEVRKKEHTKETFESAIEEQQQHENGGDMIPRVVSISSSGSEEEPYANHDDHDGSSDISSYSEEAAPLLYYSTKFAPPRGNWNHQNLDHFACDETSYHDDDDNDNDDNNDFPEDETLPAAPTRASPNTCICSISVHFDARYHQKSLIRGFTLTYTDGVELQVGDLRLTQTVIHLTPSQEGECYFTAFQVGLKRQRGPGLPAFTERIRFCTTDNQWLTATTCQRDDLSPEDDFDETTPVYRLPPDTVLRSIDWDANQHCIRGIEAIPLSLVNRPTAIIPSLRFLAYHAVHAKLKQQFVSLAREYQSSFQDVADQVDNAVRRVYKEQWLALQASHEAQLVPILHAAFQNAIQKRESFSKRLLAVAEKKRDDIVKDAKVKRAKIMQTWSQLVHDCLQDHRRYMSGIPEFDRPRQRGGGGGGGDHQQQQHGMFRLCVATGCWNMHQMDKLALHKRCAVVPDCKTLLSNCGCGVRLCTTCRQPVCFRHVASHEPACQRSSHDKCGYNADQQWLVPECCQRTMMVDAEMNEASCSYKCSACRTQCCMDCRFCCSNCGALFCIPCFQHQQGTNTNERRGGDYSCCRDPVLVPQGAGHDDDEEFEL